MTFLLCALTLLIGLGIGGAVGWMLHARKGGADATSLRDSFKALSAEVLAETTAHANAQFLTLAEQKLGQQREQTEQTLDTKKQLIDQTLVHINTELKRVNDLVIKADKDRLSSFTTLADQLGKSTRHTEELRQTTEQLKATLSNSARRGSWGERMAEDVLRLAGFVESVNYTKQSQLSNADGGKPRPDFTFKMPQNRVVHMDVKFPLEQYLVYMEATTDAARDAAKASFLREARNRVREAAKRNYAGLTAKETESTLDYSLVFIPNEQVYAFLMEHDRDLLDTAMQSKVILCSPTTLFAILAVIRQAMDNFQMQHTMGDAMKLLTDFRKQWELFSEEFTKIGQRFNAVVKDFAQIETTRYKGMERQLGKLENLKLPESESADVIDFQPDRKAS